MPLLLVVLLSTTQVFGASVNHPLTEDPDTLLISALDSPANFDPFPVYFEKKSQPSASYSATPTEIILTSETPDSQSRFSPNSRPNPKPFNLIFKKNTSNHLKVEDYFGSPQPPTPTTANGLQASLSNIKIKHRSDTSPSAFRTSNKKKIIKKHLSKQKYEKIGHRGSQHSKYQKKVKKPIKIRILSPNAGDSIKKKSENDHDKRKMPSDWRRIANDNYYDGERNEDEKKNHLMEPIQTVDKSYNKNSLSRLGAESVTTDFLGRLREMTGGQMVAVTRDKVQSKEEESEQMKENKITAQQEIERSFAKRTKSGDKKEIMKNISPAADRKSPKPIFRRKERQLNSRIPEKQQQVTTKSNHKRFDKLRSKKSNKNSLRGLNSVGTVSRYRYENADGSITWGYRNEDGSFKEETIGTDCVTHGSYGYVDPTGSAREYSYTSGIRCDPHTRKIEKTAEIRSEAGHFDHVSRKFVMPDGRRVTVRVNQNKRARGTRS